MRIRTNDDLRKLVATASQSHHLAVEMSQMRTLDPEGLALLVRARQEARHVGGRLCLVAPSKLVLTVLHTMRLEQAFPAFGDEAAALVWLGEAIPSDPGPLWVASV